jgi:dipeptidyl aminopeptidase/acylaminoacyl peptidase
VAHTLSFFGDRSAALAGLLCLATAGTLAAQAPAWRPDPKIFVYRPQPQRVAAIDVPIDPAVAPSPDGRFFAALQTRPDPVLWIVPADGGEPFAYRKIWSAYKPRWAPSGNRIGFIAGIGPMRIWTVEVDPETGRPIDPPRMLYRAPANAFAFAPDGERVAFVPRRTTEAGASEIYIVDWESRRVRFLLREEGMIYRLDWSADGEYVYFGVAPDAPDDSLHRVVRARIRGAARETIAEASEFLGLAPDGLSILYRTNDLDALINNALEVANTNGQPLLRIAVPGGAVPSWGPTSGSLVQVRARDAGLEVFVLPVPGLWLRVGALIE